MIENNRQEVGPQRLDSAMNLSERLMAAENDNAYGGRPPLPKLSDRESPCGPSPIPPKPPPKPPSREESPCGPSPIPPKPPPKPPDRGSCGPIHPKPPPKPPDRDSNTY